MYFSKYFGMHEIIRIISVIICQYQDPLFGGILSIFPVDLHDNFTVEHSGKLRVLDMMLHQLHSQQSRDRIVLVSNYTKVTCVFKLLVLKVATYIHSSVICYLTARAVR